MRPLALLILLAACGPRPRSTEDPVTTPSPSRTQPQSPVTACQHALVALADGKLDAWTGTDGCTRADVDRVFGASGKPDVASVFGPTQDYPPRAGAPYGLQVSFQMPGDTVVTIMVTRPKLTGELDALLGPPEAVLESQLGGDVEQRVWPGRGIAAHVQIGLDILTLVAFPRMTLADYERGTLPVALKAREEPFL